MVRIGTRAVHAGEQPHASGAVNTPIVAATTFRFPEAADGSPASHIYSRYDNPTVQALEAKHAALEGSDGAWAFASGMAAIASVCHTHLRPGDVLAVMRGVYGGTTAYMERELGAMGIHIHHFDAFQDEDLPAGTKLVWLESITNPLLRVPDVATWAERAHAAGAKLCVDATFASPILQRPLELGADLVVHSLTKYISGHSDVTAGVVAFNGAGKDLWETRRNHGATLDPHTAFLAMRGMKTLALRVKAQCSNALAVAEALETRVKVHYPGLPSHPDHDSGRIAAPGGVVTFDTGSKDAAIAFRRRIRLVTPAASLGGVESLASLPIETSHAYASAEARAAQGITDGLVRLSVGIEDAEDIIDDVLQALG